MLSWPWLLLANGTPRRLFALGSRQRSVPDWYVAETKYAQIKEGKTAEEVEAIMGHKRDGYLHTANLALAT